jgi:AcrR family transcriptional regulator
MAQLPEHLSKAPVGREQLSREALSEHQRERVLAAATGVFAKRGYQETTIDNIVAAAKTSVGSFYLLFDGKEDCFFSVYERIIDAGRERIAAAISAHNGWAPQVYAALRDLLEIYVEDPLSARIVLIEVQTAGPAASARHNGLLDAATAWLRVGRRRYPGATELPQSFEQASIAGLTFYLQQRLLGGEPSSVEALLEETAPLILEPILGADEFRNVHGSLAAPR